MTCSGYCSAEATLVTTVVNDLLKTLDRAPLEVDSHLVGTDSVKNILIQKLNLNSRGKVDRVGIWGFGGIGKTTVATVLYNQLYADFEAASFVFNVRATAAEATGLRKLQKQILKQLTRYDGKVHSVPEGKRLFRERLGGKRVLLVLDDVDADEQLRALDGDWLAPGSRVIITSRDQHILNIAGVSSECIHEMRGMDLNESLQLFKGHASPNPEYENLSKQIVKACYGHPLSLKVIGSFLSDKKDVTGCWTETLHNISRNPDMQNIVYNTLKISYNALSDEEKEIFVDIACFFIGEHKKWPIVFWNCLYGIGDTAVSNLSMKSLIKVDSSGYFKMHDHLLDMGRTIAQKEKKGTRLWTAAHFSTASNSTNLSHVQLKGGNPQSLEMLCTPGLRYLHLKNLLIEDVTEETIAMLPTTLIWLRLEGCNYVIGENRPTKKPRCSRSVDNVWQLKILQLKGLSWFGRFPISSLFSLPNIQVQHMNLQMKDTYMLKNLPDAIGNLSKLQRLDLKGYVNLISLPNTIGNMSQLQHLDLRGCYSLKHLPDTIGNLSQLQHLDLRGCYSLKHLPDTIGDLLRLQHLDLGLCDRLENLPHTFGNLSQLQHLDLKRCYRLNNLPDTIGNLLKLQHLDLYFCRRLNNLPKTIGNLSQLQYLDLRICVNLKNLPDSIGNLSQLRQLKLRECFSLKNIPHTIGELSQLQHLDLERCVGLSVLPDTIGCLLRLQHLNLTWCDNLSNLPDTISKLSQLQHLDLSGCNRLNNLPDTIGNLSQLQYLDLRGCDGLNYLPNTIGDLSQLQHLDLIWCDGLNNLLDTIGNLSQLKSLYWKDRRTWKGVFQGRN